MNTNSNGRRHTARCDPYISEDNRLDYSDRDSSIRYDKELRGYSNET